MPRFSFTSLLLSNLALSDRKVYEPSIRALLGTASHLYEEVFLNLESNRTVNLNSPRVIRRGGGGTMAERSPERRRSTSSSQAPLPTTMGATPPPSTPFVPFAAISCTCRKMLVRVSVCETSMITDEDSICGNVSVSSHTHTHTHPHPHPHTHTHTGGRSHWEARRCGQ